MPGSPATHTSTCPWFVRRPTVIPASIAFHVIRDMKPNASYARRVSGNQVVPPSRAAGTRGRSPMSHTVFKRSAVALAALVAAAAPASAGAAGPRAPGRIDGRYIVVFKRSVDRPLVETEKLEQAEGFESRLRYRRAVKGFAARLSTRQVRDLRADPEVAFVTPDRRVEALGSVPLAPGDAVPAGVLRTQAGSATTTREASTANVAVIDTGIDLAHPDLNATDGKNCVGTGPAQDDEGHGTHVA